MTKYSENIFFAERISSYFLEATKSLFVDCAKRVSKEIMLSKGSATQQGKWRSRKQMINDAHSNVSLQLCINKFK